MTTRPVRFGLVCAAVLAAGACKKDEPRVEPVVVAQGAAAQKLLTPETSPPAAGTAPITGTVTLTGTPPEMAMTKRDADPFCARTPTKDEEVVVGPAGQLKNVIVRITKGVTGTNYEPPMQNVTIDQTNCMYRPRVAMIMAGQSLLIRNSDQTLHNVHTYKGASTLFNQAEVPGLPAIAKTFKDATGEILKFKCDVHPWMTGYVGVSAHPFFAVTAEDGKFEIAKVPAGKYTLEAWHERFGTKSQEITVEAGKPTTVSFAFESK
jgi:plastocyanin